MSGFAWVVMVIIGIGIVTAIIKGVIAISDKMTIKRTFARMTKAAEKGGAEDQFRLGEFCLWHNKASEARPWLEKALGQGYSAAKTGLYICDFAETEHYATDFAGSVDYYSNYKKRAEEGIAIFQYLLGSAYQNCFIMDEEKIHVFYMKPDMEKAIYWFQKAADQGNPHAQCDLGACYLHGEGVEKNETLGFGLLLKAAENTESEEAKGLARKTIQQASGMSYEEFVQKHT